jgi:hypothetical protein
MGEIFREWPDEALWRVPAGLCCPVCDDVLNDPQVAADGHSYCLNCFAEHVQKHIRRVTNRRRTGQHLRPDGAERDLQLKSPVTGEPLEHTHLIPNRALQTVLKSYMAGVDMKRSSRTPEALSTVLVEAVSVPSLTEAPAAPAGPAEAAEEPRNRAAARQRTRR